jgi:hypothetical protein
MGLFASEYVQSVLGFASLNQGTGDDDPIFYLYPAAFFGKPAFPKQEDVTALEKQKLTRHVCET